jgi:transaldolase
MAIMVDSADVNEVRQAVELGIVRGCTTNPLLMAKAKESPREVIRQICAVVPGPVFYQLTAATSAEHEKEGREVHAIDPKKVHLKIPATTENMTLITRFGPLIPCAVTAIFSAHQAYLACEAGAKYIIPYVNRSTRLLGDGPKLVAEMKQAIRAAASPARILAASIKSPEEAVAAAVAGADDLTLPLDIIRALGQHRLSDEAIAEFDRAGKS